MADTIDSCCVEFVESVRTVNHQRRFGTEFVENLCERLRKFGIVAAGELDMGTGRIRQRTEHIENRALTNFLAWTDGIFHRWMKFCSEHKPDANLLDGL